MTMAPVNSVLDVLPTASLASTELPVAAATNQTTIDTSFLAHVSVRQASTIILYRHALPAATLVRHVQPQRHVPAAI